MVKIKSNKLPLIQQKILLEKTFPKSKVQIIGHKMIIWKYQLKPTALSTTYSIKMTYCENERPHVYITEPTQLKLAEGEYSLPHVYNHAKQELCLYWKNWDATMSLANTIVPWIADWLFYYEVWVFTGIWEGGGIHFNNKEPSKKLSK